MLWCVEFRCARLHVALLSGAPALRNHCCELENTESALPRMLRRAPQPVLVCPWRQEWPVRPRPGTGSPFASQCGQDAFLDTALFGAAHGGIYLDIGCNDGKSNSNTWFFAKLRGWKGICLEADPRKFREIPFASGRSDGINAAVSNKDGTASFAVVNVADGGLSGLTTTLDHARAQTFGPMRSVLTVPTVSPLSLLKKYYPNATKALDYVSIDVEGHELEVLRSWPLSRSAWCVNVFTVENNHWCNRTEGILPQVKQILGSDYTHVRSLGVDELFVRRTPCSQATVALKMPPYRVPQYIDPSHPIQTVARHPNRRGAPTHAGFAHHHHQHSQHHPPTPAARHVQRQPQGQGFRNWLNTIQSTPGR